jgi:hypothetical protein
MFNFQFRISNLRCRIRPISDFALASIQHYLEGSPRRDSFTGGNGAHLAGVNATTAEALISVSRQSIAETHRPVTTASAVTTLLTLRSLPTAYWNKRERPAQYAKNLDFFIC